MNVIFVSFLIVLLSFAIAWQVQLNISKKRSYLLEGLEAPDYDGIQELLKRTKDVQPSTWLEKKQYQLEQAGSTHSLQRFLVISFAFATGGFALSMTFSGNVLMSVLVGAVAFYVPNFQLKRNRRKNLEKFNLFFRNTLIRMASMLRAGGSTKQAILGIAQNNDTNEIVRNEFKRAYTDLEFGYTVEEAFMRMYHRTGSEDVRIVSIVMEIQRQKGGNLAELLDSLQQTITERQNQKRRIKTLTAAQTSQANLLTAIPFLVFGFFWIYNPSYYKEFFENIIGVFMTIVCVILIFIGNFIMRKMASPK